MDVIKCRLAEVETKVRRIRVLEIVGNGEGGGTKCVARIVSDLNPDRYEITAISPEAPWLAEVCAQHGAIYCPLPLLNSRVNPKTYADLAGILARTEPDIISAHGTRAMWYALRAIRTLSRVPRLVYSEHLFSFDARRGIVRWPWIQMESYICRCADMVTTGCEANARFIESKRWKRPDEIAIRHYGIELETFKEQAANRVSKQDLGFTSDLPLVGTVGRLIPQKGMRYWLDAAAQVLKEMPQVQFIVIGDGESRWQLEQQCRRLDIARHVHFLGQDRQPWRILATCDVVAFSSLFEGLQMTAVEALAAGVPTVATRHKGTVEYIRSGWNGLLVAPRDTRALARAILELLRNPALRGRLAARGPDSVAEYHTGTMIAKFDAMYEMLYAKRQLSVEADLPTRLGGTDKLQDRVV